MTDDRLEDLKNIQLDLAKKAGSEALHYSNRFDSMLEELESISERILDHYYNGDLTDQEMNSKLWHDLYNVEHKIQNFAKYSEKSAQEFLEESKKLIQPLKDIRPPKELH